MFCGFGASSMNMLYREFGCDAVLCRAGSFNAYGHATLHSSCRDCPELKDDKTLGHTYCPSKEYLHGDLDGDGILSHREILRMLFVDTLGRFWGELYQTWADIKVHECDLQGIKCAKKKIVRIDLSGAELCSNGERRPGPRNYCKGLPPELGNIDTLEVLQLTRRQFLRGTLPTEIGKLTKLQLLDASTCSSLSGTIPTEIGLLTNLRRLNLAHSRFRGTIPTEIFQLTLLEKLHLTNNILRGSLPTHIGKLTQLKELMFSR